MTVTTPRRLPSNRRPGPRTSLPNPQNRSIIVGTAIATGRPATVELSARTPHILITGDRSSGKTHAFNAIAHQLCTRFRPNEMALMVAAPTAGNDLLGVINSEHTTSSLHQLPAPNPKDAVRQWCSTVFAEIDTRLSTGNRRPATAVMIDDLAHLADIHPPVYDVVEQVCLDGPSVGMHMITSATTATVLREDWALRWLHTGFRLVGRCSLADTRQLLAGYDPITNPAASAARPTMHLLRLRALSTPEPIAVPHPVSAATSGRNALPQKECS